MCFDAHIHDLECSEGNERQTLRTSDGSGPITSHLVTACAAARLQLTKALQVCAVSATSCRHNIVLCGAWSLSLMPKSRSFCAGEWSPYCAHGWARFLEASSNPPTHWTSTEWMVGIVQLSGVICQLQLLAALITQIYRSTAHAPDLSRRSSTKHRDDHSTKRP